VVVLHITGHLFHVLQRLRDLLFPGAGIRHDVGDVAEPLAVELAEELGVTLVGFLRESNFNMYSRPERIVT